jgi:hypothetical protein
MPLSSVENDFLNFLEQFWYEHGSLPSKDYCNEILGEYDTNSLWKCFSRADFRDALLSRGVSLRGTDFASSGLAAKGRVLTEMQLAVANTMLDLRDNRSAKKKLQDLGISTQQYEGWLRDPAYQQYITQRAENALGDNQHEAHLALVGRVRSGDVSAIKYFNEITGRYVPNRVSNLDISVVLMRVVESVQKHVTDPAIQEAIAQDLMALAQADSSNANTRTVTALPVGVSI